KDRYGCVPNPGRVGCGKVLVTVEFADAVVRDMVLTALQSPEFTDRLHRRVEVDPGVREAIAADERRLEELAEEWADGGLTRGEWRTARERSEARLERNRATLARSADMSALDGLHGSYDDLRALWEARNTSQRRAIVSAVLTSVTV